jgi:hypothetical protein
MYYLAVGAFLAAPMTFDKIFLFVANGAALGVVLSNPFLPALAANSSGLADQPDAF